MCVCMCVWCFYTWSSTEPSSLYAAVIPVARCSLPCAQDLMCICTGFKSSPFKEAARLPPDIGTAVVMYPFSTAVPFQYCCSH